MRELAFVIVLKYESDEGLSWLVALSSPVALDQSQVLMAVVANRGRIII